MRRLDREIVKRLAFMALMLWLGGCGREREPDQPPKQLPIPSGPPLAQEPPPGNQAEDRESRRP